MNQLINKPLSQSDDVFCIGEQKTNSILYNILTLRDWTKRPLKPIALIYGSSANT